MVVVGSSASGKAVECGGVLGAERPLAKESEAEHLEGSLDKK